jgi:ketosteroid isomerase-like protein
MKNLMSQLVLLGLVSMLATQSTLAQQDVDAQALADRWTQAYNNHDRANLSGLYADNAYLMMHGGPTIKGRDAIGDLWAEDFMESNPITTLKVTHALQGVDMILVHGDYQVINRNDGMVHSAGRFAHVWMMENGQWLLDRDMWNRPFDPYAGQ